MDLFFCKSISPGYRYTFLGTNFDIHLIMKQTTLRSPVIFQGVGLHSGKEVRVCIHPAPADSGFVFALRGQDGLRYLAPSPRKVVATGLATTLGEGGSRVSTVEHLLAALVGLEIDNALVEVHGEEIPIMDGSAATFVAQLKSVGRYLLDQKRRVARIKRPVSLEKEGKRISASPYNGLRIEYAIDFPHPKIGAQVYTLECTPHSFATQIASARTFGFVKDIEFLHKNGLAKGGSLDNAVVFSEKGILNPDGLRYADEMVRHKILDFLGDIGVAAYRLRGRFSVSCSGHEFNNQFVQFLFDNASSYLDIDRDVAPAFLPGEWAERLVSGAVPAWA